VRPCPKAWPPPEGVPPAKENNLQKWRRLKKELIKFQRELIFSRFLGLIAKGDGRLDPKNLAPYKARKETTFVTVGTLTRLGNLTKTSETKRDSREATCGSKTLSSYIEGRIPEIWGV